MTTKTRDELAEAVLQSMTVIGANETPDTNDSAYVISQYNAKYAELAAPPEELAYWTKTAIPEEIFLTVVDLVKNECLPAFGQPMPADAKEAADQVIMRRLRRHTHVKSSGHAAQGEYF